VIYQLFIAMCLSALLFRTRLSPVSVARHIGAIVIAQNAVAMSLNWEHERDATIEFIHYFILDKYHILKTIKALIPCPDFPSSLLANKAQTPGTFAIIAYSRPHVAIGLYRVYTTHHNFLGKVFCLSSITTFTGTILETMTVS
jgi:hypothetical protein